MRGEQKSTGWADWRKHTQSGNTESRRWSHLQNCFFPSSRLLEVLLWWWEEGRTRGLWKGLQIGEGLTYRNLCWNDPSELGWGALLSFGGLSVTKHSISLCISFPPSQWRDPKPWLQRNGVLFDILASFSSKVLDFQDDWVVLLLFFFNGLFFCLDCIFI